MKIGLIPMNVGMDVDGTGIESNATHVQEPLHVESLQAFGENVIART